MGKPSAEQPGTPEEPWQGATHDVSPDVSHEGELGAANALFEGQARDEAQDNGVWLPRSQQEERMPPGRHRRARTLSTSVPDQEDLVRAFRVFLESAEESVRRPSESRTISQRDGDEASTRTATPTSNGTGGSVGSSAGVTHAERSGVDDEPWRRTGHGQHQRQAQDPNQVLLHDLRAPQEVLLQEPHEAHPRELHPVVRQVPHQGQRHIPRQDPAQSLGEDPPQDPPQHLHRDVRQQAAHHVQYQNVLHEKDQDQRQVRGKDSGSSSKMSESDASLRAANNIEYDLTGRGRRHAEGPMLLPDAVAFDVTPEFIVIKGDSRDLKFRKDIHEFYEQASTVTELGGAVIYKRTHTTHGAVNGPGHTAPPPGYCLLLVSVTPEEDALKIVNYLAGDDMGIPLAVVSRPLSDAIWKNVEYSGRVAAPSSWVSEFEPRYTAILFISSLMAIITSLAAETMIPLAGISLLFASIGSGYMRGLSTYAMLYLDKGFTDGGKSTEWVLYVVLLWILLTYSGVAGDISKGTAFDMECEQFKLPKKPMSAIVPDQATINQATINFNRGGDSIVWAAPPSLPPTPPPSVLPTPDTVSPSSSMLSANPSETSGGGFTTSPNNPEGGTTNQPVSGAEGGGRRALVSGLPGMAARKRQSARREQKAGDVVTGMTVELVGEWTASIHIDEWGGGSFTGSEMYSCEIGEPPPSWPRFVGVGVLCFAMFSQLICYHRYLIFRNAKRGNDDRAFYKTADGDLRRLIGGDPRPGWRCCDIQKAHIAPYCLVKDDARRGIVHLPMEPDALGPGPVCVSLAGCVGSPPPAVNDAMDHGCS